MEFNDTEKRIFRDGEPVYVQSLHEYIEKVMDLTYQNEKPYWYRGHGVADWPLIPGIQRSLKEMETLDEFYQKERYSTNNFQCYASSFLQNKPAMGDFSAWLTIMQHYGVRTRLLDWSRSPLYALYFATQNFEKYKEKDACVWLLDTHVLSEYVHLEKKNIPYYHVQHNTVKDVIYTAFREYHPQRYCRFGGEHKRRHERYLKTNNTIVACFPTETDGRVYNQQSVFTVHSSVKRLTEIHDELKQDGKGDLLIEIIIPAGYKKDIFEQLFICGIGHSNVYPDMEHLALDIRRINPWA